jgi:uncharacterized membrane protein
MADTDDQGLGEQPETSGSDNGGGSALSSLKTKEILLPAAATAAAAAIAGLAAKKGPDLMKKMSGEANEEAEELGRKGAEGAKKELGGGLAGKAASKLMGGGGGGGGGGKTRRLPIQRWTDVAVPVEKAYKSWTQFEEFPKFMHRVLDVNQEDNEVRWTEKIWFSTRQWTGEITEKRQNDRIAWKSTSGTQHSGVISFHKLDKNLTRVLVTVDFVPSGMIEKMASGMRFVKRAVEADLARFKAYVELGDAKGLQYRAKPEEMEQHREGGDDDGDEQQDSDEETQSSGEKEQSSGDDESSENGDRDRESERQERESRREERRGALSSS